MSALLAFWSHALAAVLFATLLIWQLREGVRGTGQRVLLAGLLLTCGWAWLTAIQPHSLLDAFAETARNLVWIGLLHALSGSPQEDGQHFRGVRLVYAAVAAVLGIQFVVDTLSFTADTPDPALATAALVLRAAAAAGGLVLVHNLYGQASPTSRTSIRLVMIALALVWLYDLNYYTLAYHGAGVSGTLFDARGGFVALTAPLFALGGKRTEGWRVRLSHAATFQSLSLLALCSYFAVMAVLATALRGGQWDWTRAAGVLLLAGMTVAAVVFLPSARARGWLKVKAAKHLFEHRYDYRAEWLRFAATLGRSGPEAPPLAERIVKALADILDAPAGLLLAAGENGRIELEASWNWPSRLPQLTATPAILDPLWREVEAKGRVLELDAHRRRRGHPSDLALPVPKEMLADDRLWAGVPLVHNDRLVGLVLLAAPESRRPLDWEDFDLLRTAGRQAGSSLAEAHGQQALMNAQRFEEFNRRFAFILHDIKNLVSQLSLLTRNAERHADNPDFRADMVATLKGSVGKMNELLARLAPQSGAAPVQPSAAFPLLPVLTSAIAAKRRDHDVRLIGQASAEVSGDPAGLEQAVAHLVQNAVDASPRREPVIVRVSLTGEQVAIEVADKGCGMDAEFIRARLFQPFASTKAGGFGIGAFEARALILGMGGQLSVDSRPRQGTRFTIHLPAAPAQTLRKSA